MLYGIVGASDLYSVAEGLEHTLPSGAVPVLTERPTPEAILKADGTWENPILPTPGPDIPIGVAESLYQKALDPVLNPEAVALVALLDL